MAYSGPMTNASGTKDKASAGDPIPPKCSVIEVHVGELKQLFNAIDPSPFRDKDLDPKAEEFIVGWAGVAKFWSTGSGYQRRGRVRREGGAWAQ